MKLKTLIPNESSKIYLLGVTEPLTWEYDETSGLTIQVPEKNLQELGATEAWVFKISGRQQ